MSFDHIVYQRKRYLRQKEKFIQEMGGRCVLCGSTQPLEFDHIDPASKKYTVTSLLSKYSDSSIRMELKKCQLLCSPCHHEKTKREAKNRPAWNAGTRKEHGSYHGAYRMKCTCAPCILYKEERKASRRKPQAHVVKRKS